MSRMLAALSAAVLAVLVLAAPASAFDADQVFQKGSLIGSLEAGGGSQANFENFDHTAGLVLGYAGARLGYLPFDPVGPSILHGSLETGLEAVYQHYFEPDDRFYAGLAAVLKYHVLSFGRFVPYVELAGAAGGTDLKIPEIKSTFAFLLWTGVGAQVFITDRTAIYAGYRLVHVSNGNTDTPNRGFEAHTGVVGVSFFLK